MFRLILVAFLFQGINGTIFSRLMGRSSSSPSSYYSSQIQQPAVISIVSCNSSENPLPHPQYQISLTVPNNNNNKANNYFTPSILNYAPSSSSSYEDNNDMDIGNRIQSPLTNFVKPWIPSRFNVYSTNRPATISNSGQNNFILEDIAEKTLDVENGVKFYLFTRKNPVASQELKLHQKITLMNDSFFSPDLETKLIFHGFTDVDAPGEWVNVMKESYLAISNVNLIVADFSSFPLHNLLRSSLPIFASKRLSEFITFLSTEAGVGLNTIHVIARSYGCHVVGISGRQLGGKLGRISALEPSPKIAVGVGSSSSEIKLNKDDALFVDVVHVNGQRFFFHGPQFGLVAPLGHFDLYPSVAEKGLGCPGENLNFRRYSLRFCHLGRGVRYFTKSIKYPEMYPMCQCSSFENYKSGQCSCAQRETMRFLGEISNTTFGVFQLAPVPQQHPSISYFPGPPNNFFG